MNESYRLTDHEVPEHATPPKDSAREAIGRPTFCDQCGYNLVTLPKQGMCPECGASYDARVWAPKNIFDPTNIRFPTSKLVKFILCLLASLWLLGQSMNAVQSWTVFFSVVFLAFSAVFGKQCLDAIADYRRRSVLRIQLISELPQPNQQEADDDGPPPLRDSGGGLNDGSRRALGLNISSHWFCATCGQCLYDHPRIGTCPSCETHYDARSSTRRNIFEPHTAEVEWADFFFAAVFLGVLLSIVTMAFLPAPAGLMRIAIRGFMGLLAIAPAILFWRFARPFVSALMTRYKYRVIWTHVVNYRTHRVANADASDDSFTSHAQGGASTLGMGLPFEGLEHSVHCGGCGYSLYKAPRAGTCPECGNAYNADPLNMSGVFLPGDASFPLFDIILTVVAGVLGLPRLVYGIRHRDLNEMVLGIFFTTLGLGIATLTWSKLKRFLHECRIAKRISQDDT